MNGPRPEPPVEPPEHPYAASARGDGWVTLAKMLAAVADYVETVDGRTAVTWHARIGAEGRTYVNVVIELP